MFNNQLGRQKAEEVSKNTEKTVKFVCFEDGIWEFSLERRRNLKMIDINGNITQEPDVHDNYLQKNCFPVYYSVKTPHLEDLEFLVKNGLSYES